jgi:SAM-dependent methyltransferase
MICPVCGSNCWEFERRYNEPDKYERLAGVIQPICRAWYTCSVCELKKVRHSYDISILDHVYTNGYRSKKFRGDDIEREFNRILALPPSQSENRHRISFVSRFIEKTDNVLDVGTGLGVFLYELPVWHERKHAIEPNKDSAQFLNDKLHMKCKHSFYKPGLFGKRFDWITCVHVLEHVENPEEMLLSFKDDLQDDGMVFIEVPDAKEFKYLSKDNDEFNSMHLHFFNPGCLYRLLESCGYTVMDMHMCKTTARALSRIMVVAHANS